MESQQTNSSDAAPSPSLIAGLVDLAKNVLGLLFSRIELAALELAEVRATLLKLALIFALGIVTTWFALAYWTAVIVALAWESLGWTILMILALAFSLMTVAILMYVRSLLKQGKLSLAATMTELRQDRDALL